MRNVTRGELRTLPEGSVLLVNRDSQYHLYKHPAVLELFYPDVRVYISMSDRGTEPYSYPPNSSEGWCLREYNHTFILLDEQVGRGLLGYFKLSPVGEIRVSELLEQLGVSEKELSEGAST